MDNKMYPGLVSSYEIPLNNWIDYLYAISIFLCVFYPWIQTPKIGNSVSYMLPKSVSHPISVEYWIEGGTDVKNCFQYQTVKI